MRAVFAVGFYTLISENNGGHNNNAEVDQLITDERHDISVSSLELADPVHSLVIQVKGFIFTRNSLTLIILMGTLLVYISIRGERILTDNMRIHIIIVVIIIVFVYLVVN
jgi:hypothetical protein